MFDVYDIEDDYYNLELSGHEIRELEQIINEIPEHPGCTVTQIASYDLFLIQFNDGVTIKLRWNRYSVGSFIEELANEIVSTYKNVR